MIEGWLIEFVRALGKLFLNPLLYWSVLLIVVTGYKRIQRERLYFGFKIFDMFSEWKNTWFFSILAGALISLITLSLGIVFSYEIILLLSVVIILLSLHLRYTLLSASYTIGMTYVLILLSPLVLENQTYLNINLFSETNFTSLAILLGIFLMIESLLLLRVKRNDTFPELSLSKRGVWIGQHQLKKLSIIPFFVLIPSGFIEPFANNWPLFSFGAESYSLFLIPFVTGFDFTVRGNLPQHASVYIGKSIRLLSLVVLVIAIGSMFISWLSIIAVIVGLIGKEYIHYKHRTTDKHKHPFFNQMDQGLKVLAVISGTPADRLGILVGETIYRVNGQRISTVDEFYEALQVSGAYFKLEVLDDRGEMRFVQSAFYDDDHYKLGLVFTDQPYRYVKTS